MVLLFMNTVTHAAAVPPDVRKVSDFPHRLTFMSGLRPEELGVAQIFEIGKRKGPAFPHIERQSRQPKLVSVFSRMLF